MGQGQGVFIQIIGRVVQKSCNPCYKQLAVVLPIILGMHLHSEFQGKMVHFVVF